MEEHGAVDLTKSADGVPRQRGEQGQQGQGQEAGRAERPADEAADAGTAAAAGAGAVADGVTQEVREGTERRRESSKLVTGVAVVAAALLAALVLFAVFHLLGFHIPFLGLLLAKGAIKLVVGGAAGLVGLIAWLKQRGGEEPPASR